MDLNQNEMKDEASDLNIFLFFPELLENKHQQKTNGTMSLTVDWNV